MSTQTQCVSVKCQEEFFIFFIFLDKVLTSTLGWPETPAPPVSCSKCSDYRWRPQCQTWERNVKYLCVYLLLYYI